MATSSHKEDIIAAATMLPHKDIMATVLFSYTRKTKAKGSYRVFISPTLERLEVYSSCYHKGRGYG